VSVDPVSLASAGPWAVVIALGIGAITFLVVGARRKWYVWGWVYEEQREARITSDATAATTTKALLGMTREFREVRKEVASLKAEVASLKAHIIELGGRVNGA
jgi:hypothetical protein